jgi:hypothetical protein
MYLEIIEGHYGYGICLDDDGLGGTLIAGHCGGGVMHTVKRCKVDEDRLKESLKKIGYKLVEIKHVKKEKNESLH